MTTSIGFERLRPFARRRAAGTTPWPSRRAAGVLVSLGAVALAADAAALAISFAVDVPQPAKQVSVVIGIYPGSGSLEMAGTLDAEIDVSGNRITAFAPAGANLSIGDLTIRFGPAQDAFLLRGVTATLLGPAALFVGADGDTSTFDLAGSRLVFVSGRASVCCSGGSGSVDFAAEPVEFLYGPGSLAELTASPAGDGGVAVVAAFPLTLDTVYPPPPSPGVVSFSMSMDLAASGLAARGLAATAVPEPGAGSLVALGLLGLAVRARGYR